MNKILVDREVLQAAVESIGARYSNLTLEEWDEVAEGIFQHLLDQPDAPRVEETHCPHGVDVYDYCKLCDMEVSRQFKEQP